MGDSRTTGSYIIHSSWTHVVSAGAAFVALHGSVLSACSFPALCVLHTPVSPDGVLAAGLLNRTCTHQLFGFFAAVPHNLSWVLPSTCQC